VHTGTNARKTVLAGSWPAVVAATAGADATGAEGRLLATTQATQAWSGLELQPVDGLPRGVVGAAERVPCVPQLRRTLSCSLDADAHSLAPAFRTNDKKLREGTKMSRVRYRNAWGCREQCLIRSGAQRSASLRGCLFLPREGSACAHSSVARLVRQPSSVLCVCADGRAGLRVRSWRIHCYL
jgi:hypothetical protein